MRVFFRVCKENHAAIYIEELRKQNLSFILLKDMSLCNSWKEDVYSFSSAAYFSPKDKFNKATLIIGVTNLKPIGTIPYERYNIVLK